MANLEFNARNQITLWGPNGEIIDYAAKVGWAGLVGDFYGSRWDIFLQYVVNATTSGTPPDWDQYYRDILAYSQAWGVATNAFPTTPNGVGPTANALSMVAKYASGNMSNYDVVTGTDAGVAPPAGECVKLPTHHEAAAVCVHARGAPSPARRCSARLLLFRCALVQCSSRSATTWPPSAPTAPTRHTGRGTAWRFARRRAALTAPATWVAPRQR